MFYDIFNVYLNFRNQFYWFDVIWQDGTSAINEKQLIANLRAIKDDATRTADIDAATDAVGVLTTEHRVSWANLRAELKKENKDTLSMVNY